MADLREQLETALGATYRIERELGGGGMSRVFLATEAGLDRQVVIKVLPRDLAQLLNPERFEREIQIAAKLQHPHVVALLSAGQAGGVRYYVMPWIEGESLRARLAREPQPPLGETLRILRDTADGLAYAHARGIVHRDIKPENILLSGDHAVVTDFGVAKALTDAAGGGSGLTSVGLVIGTPAYMAPEQAAADPNVNAAADVYALGVIGYEMLAGEAPFQGGTPQALLAAHIAKTPVPLAERRPDLPASLVALIDRCLAKQPEARPEAAAIVRELERLNTSAGTVVSRALPAPRFWDRRHGRVATVLVIVALAALGIRAWLGRGGSTPPAQPTLAILPLTPGTQDTALTRLGRELALTLSATLDGIGEFRTVDPLSVLALVPEDGKLLGAEAVLTVARKFGATQALTGSLVHVNDQVRLDLSLISTSNGEVTVRSTLTGPGDDINALTDSATWALLRQGWKGGFTAPPTLSEVTTRSLDALRDYLRGERLSVRGEWEEAEAAYAEAFGADTSFLLAYVGYSRVRSWALKGVDRAIRFRLDRNIDRLPEREAFIRRAELSTPFTSDSLLREATRRWPDWWPGWFSYGDRMLHFGGPAGHPRVEAMQAFQRTVELNPRLVIGYHHLVWAARSIRPDIAHRAAATLDSLEPNGFLGRMQRVYQDAVEQAPVSGELVDSAEALLQTLPRPLLRLGPVFFRDAPSLQIQVNDRSARADPASAAASAQGNAALWAARGRWDSALASASRYARLSDDEAGTKEEYAYAAVAAWLGALPDTVAAASRARLEPDLVRLSNLERTEVLWLDGIRAWARGDSAALRSAQQSLHRFLTASGFADSIQRIPERSLAAFALALGGRKGEAGRRLAELEWALADTLPVVWWWPSPWAPGIHRLAASRLLATAGDTTQAIRLLRWVDEEGASPSFLRSKLGIGGISLVERADLEAAAGRREEAFADYRWFLRIFDQPMPSLVSLRTRAERGLAALEGRKE